MRKHFVDNVRWLCIPPAADRNSRVLRADVDRELPSAGVFRAFRECHPHIPDLCRVP